MVISRVKTPAGSQIFCIDFFFIYFSRDQRAQQDHPPRRLRQQALLQRRRGLRLQGRPYSTRIGYNAGMLSSMSVSFSSVPKVIFLQAAELVINK